MSNGIVVAKAPGVRQPKVALLAAADRVLPKLPVTVEIAEIVAVRERWSPEGALVDGPFRLDTAASPQIARERGRDGAVTGHDKMLVGPDVESVNIMATGTTCFAGGRMAGVIVGGRSPLVVSSHPDPLQTRLVSITAGASLAATWDREAGEPTSAQ